MANLRRAPGGVADTGPAAPQAAQAHALRQRARAHIESIYSAYKMLLSAAKVRRSERGGRRKVCVYACVCLCMPVCVWLPMRCGWRKSNAAKRDRETQGPPLPYTRCLPDPLAPSPSRPQIKSEVEIGGSRARPGAKAAAPKLMGSTHGELEEMDVELHAASLARAAEQLSALCSQLEEAVLVHDVAAINADIRARTAALSATLAAEKGAALQAQVERSLVFMREADEAAANARG